MYSFVAAIDPQTSDHRRRIKRVVNHSHPVAPFSVRRTECAVIDERFTRTIDYPSALSASRPTTDGHDSRGQKTTSAHDPLALYLSQ